MEPEQYNVIYADPPWAYRNKNTGGSMTSGAAAKYPTMSIDEICNLSIIQKQTDKDSVLFLWATVPLLPEAFDVLRAWRYQYKTTIVWRKTGRLGLGFWFRGECEFLLFGIRGRVKAFRLQEPNILALPALRHSEKPEEFRQLIERATAGMPDPRRLELFARRRVPGWNAWGNEI